MGFRFWSWHQKLTVTIDTPNGQKSSYAVTKANWNIAPPWFRIGDSRGQHGGGSLKGEAVVPEVEHGKYLFVLLRDYPAELTVQLFAEPSLKTDDRNEFTRVLNRIYDAREMRSLRPEQYPTLVTFKDNDDPSSVIKVDPLHLDASFDPGYRLKSITLEITDEPVTEGRVKRTLAWIDLPREKFLALGEGENPIRIKEGKQTINIGTPAFVAAD